MSEKKRIIEIDRQMDGEGERERGDYGEKVKLIMEINALKGLSENVNDNWYLSLKLN